MIQFKDLPPRGDVKGGSPKTPPGGIPTRQFKKYLEESSGNDVSLKEYFDRMLTEMDRRLTDAVENSKEAVKIAGAAQDKRLDLLNEFRAQSQDEGKQYASRETVESLASQVAKIWGGLVVVALVGIANLVKLFFTH